MIDANEIIQKFKTQGLTTSSLEELKDSYKKRIEELKQEKDRLRGELEEQKFMKDSGKPQRRRLDEI